MSEANKQITYRNMQQTGGGWFNPYIKVKGEWKYYYRAVDKQGYTIDFLLTARRDTTAVLRFSCVNQKRFRSF